MLLAAPIAYAQTAKPATKPAPTAPQSPPAAPGDADAAFLTAKAAFDALTEGERRALQEALIWTGDFQGTATGEFGKRTRDALVAFEKRINNSPDGAIDAKELAKLLATAAELKKNVGFAVVSDAVSGAQIGVPQKLLSARSANPDGLSFTSPSGGQKLTLFSVKGPDADLTKFYEKTGAASAERKITYKLIKPDYIVITGEAGAAKFYTRAARVSAGGEATLRGFTLTYPLAIAKDFDTIALAIANSFSPQPGASIAAVDAGKGGAAPTPPPRPASVGVIVTATLIAAGRAVAILPPGCTAPTIAGAPARIAGNDPESGMTLLEAPAKSRPVAFGATLIADGAELIIAGFGDSAAAQPAASLNAASGAATVSADAPDRARVLAPIQPPSAGSAVFDRLGGFVGLIARANKEPRRYAGVTPMASHQVIALASVLRFAGLSGTSPPSSGASDAPRTTGEVVSAVRGALLGVECAK